MFEENCAKYTIIIAI